MRRLDIAAVFHSYAEDLLRARQDSIRIHGTADIRAAGNEVEETIRSFFRKILPPRYYVTHGHLIDIHGFVSPQIDLIISDNFNIPSLMTTKDGTEYVPIDSVYAIGELKSSYYKSERYIEHFSDVIEGIRENLYHEEIPNTGYWTGGELHPNATFHDIALGKKNKVFNRILSFMLFVDAGNFRFSDISRFFTSREKRFLPNITTLLNLGTIQFGELGEDQFIFHRYAEESDNALCDWYFGPWIGDDTRLLEGGNLGYLYYNLLEHLNNSYLEPPSVSKYLAPMLKIQKSAIQKARP